MCRLCASSFPFKFVPSFYILLYLFDLTFSLKFQFHSLWINSRNETSHKNLEHSIIVKNSFDLLIAFMCMWGEKKSKWITFGRKGHTSPSKQTFGDGYKVPAHHPLLILNWLFLRLHDLSSSKINIFLKKQSIKNTLWEELKKKSQWQCSWNSP